MSLTEMFQQSIGERNRSRTGQERLGGEDVYNNGKGLFFCKEEIDRMVVKFREFF